MTGFEQAWTAAPVAVRRCLELAHQSLRAGGLAVGAVLVDGAGLVRAEGRNRAYDGPGGDDPLQGTPLAHAELNALAVVRTGTALGGLTLWSTQQPCDMCAAALAFTGVGAVRHLAPDPWALATGRSGSTAGDGEPEWLIAANLLFLQSIADTGGPDHPTVRRSRTLEPETTALLTPAPTAAGSVPEHLAPLWSRIRTAATTRTNRLIRTAGALNSVMPK
ncbi:nucleoside deaminase [Kitasatospora sp. NPDC058965]|uniref:nucleoside deaminase n=1 Tax=Kitasatospora sp. NPDC058965 TaxID=3346682 RepID=UPI0036B802A3